VNEKKPTRNSPPRRLVLGDGPGKEEKSVRVEKGKTQESSEVTLFGMNRDNHVWTSKKDKGGVRRG